MPKLPSQNRIANEIYEAAADTFGEHRSYLGMSQIGLPCERALWLQFRGFTSHPPDGRVNMIFRLGQLIEDEVICLLKKAGYQVDSQQKTFVAHNGHFRGHCDGIIYRVTSVPHILEIKSANDRNFRAFSDHGIRNTNPAYYCQAQCYMGYSGLNRALFVVENKNTCKIYTERIYLNKFDFNNLHQRAYRIITTNELPKKQFAEDSVFCQWCNYRLQCWYPEEVIMKNRVCGTCHYLWWLKLEKWCRHPDHSFKILQWGLGCSDWENIFEKHQIKKPRVSLGLIKHHIED